MSNIRLPLGSEDWHALRPDAKYRRTLEHLGQVRTATLSALERARIQATLSLIPPDVTSLLDVGAGDGRLLQQLPHDIWAVGADYALTSVKRIAGTRLCASSQRLPFPDRAFDTLVCCEVLEHLPQAMFQPVIHELERVADRHLVLTVPYKENLLARQTKCPQCQSVFHIWGHVRRFQNRDLHGLFPHFAVAATRYHGRRPPYQSRLALALNQRFGNRWADGCETSICPRCGNTDFARTPRNAVTVLCGLLNFLTGAVSLPSHKNWVLKRYTRKA